MSLSPVFNIEYEELDGSPTGDVDECGFVGTRVFRCAWDDKQPFIDELMGLSQFGGWQGGGRPSASVNIIEPAVFPGWRNARVTSCSFKPFGSGSENDGQTGANLLSSTGRTRRFPNAGAEVTAKYASLFPSFPASAHEELVSLSIPTGTHISYERDFSGEIMTLPGEELYWGTVGGGDKLSEDNVSPGVVIPSSQHVITWFWIHKPPWATIRKLVGTVNETAFLGAPAETMLFLGCQPIPLFRNQPDETLFKLVYRFAEQSKLLNNGTTTVGWNHFFRPVTSGERWQKVVSNGDRPIYPLASHSTLFAYGV